MFSKENENSMPSWLPRLYRFVHESLPLFSNHARTFSPHRNVFLQNSVRLNLARAPQLTSITLEILEGPLRDHLLVDGRRSYPTGNRNAPWSKPRRGVQHHHAILAVPERERHAKGRADTEQTGNGCQRIPLGIHHGVVHLLRRNKRHRSDATVSITRHAWLLRLRHHLDTACYRRGTTAPRSVACSAVGSPLAAEGDDRPISLAARTRTPHCTIARLLHREASDGTNPAVQEKKNSPYQPARGESTSDQPFRTRTR